MVNLCILITFMKHHYVAGCSIACLFNNRPAELQQPQNLSYRSISRTVVFSFVSVCAWLLINACQQFLNTNNCVKAAMHVVLICDPTHPLIRVLPSSHRKGSLPTGYDLSSEPKQRRGREKYSLSNGEANYQSDDSSFELSVILSGYFDQQLWPHQLRNST